MGPVERDVHPAAHLLPFHKSILTTLADPTTSQLVILARGLGLRRILTTLLNIFSTPDALVLLLNAAPDEEVALVDELSLVGCARPGLRIVDYEILRSARYALSLYSSFMAPY